MDVERSVRSWMVSEKEAEVEKLIEGISTDSITLLDIVKALGEYLTSEVDDLRTKGVQLLSLLIARCSKDGLNRQSVRVLTSFYCSKLEDAETITPALSGLSHLVTFPSFSSLEVTEALPAIFQHVKMQALVQSTRFLVYKIVESLMDTFRDHLQTMGEQFLSGYATLVSGEKDPRNLLIAFKITRVILTDFDITKHVEDYFDITFCYYPITFRPPPNDPYGISTDDLKSSLRACLSATSAFGHLGMNLFIEKLAIGSSVTKRDILQTLIVCFPVYGIGTATEFGQKIWSALKLEIFEPTDPLTEEMALDTLRVFVRVLRSDDVNDAVDTVVQTICTDSLAPIGEPEKAQARAGVKVLCVLADVHSKFGHHGITDAINKLTELFHDPGEVSNRPSVVVLLTELLDAFVAPPTLEASATSGLASKGPFAPASSLLTSYKDAILGMLITGLKSPSTRLPTVHALSSLIRLPAFLTDTELGYIVLEIGSFVGREPDEIEDITSDILSLLFSISRVSPHHLADQILPSLFAMLPDQAPPLDAQSERAQYWRALCALSKLCVQPTLFEILVIRLTAKLEFLRPSFMSDGVSSGGKLATEADERSAAYAHALLLTLRDALSAKVTKAKPDPDVPKYVDQLLPHLFRLFLGAAVTSGHQIFGDQRLLRLGAQIVKLVVEALSVEQQQGFIEAMDAAFLDGQVKAVTRGEFVPIEVDFRPTDVLASAPQRETMILFSAAHVPIRKVSVTKTPVMKAQLTLSAFLQNLVLWCDSSICSALQREAASELFSTLVNKYTDDVRDFLDDLLTKYYPDTLSNPRVPLETRANAIDNWIWISRALVVQSHPSALSFIDPLFTLLDDEVISWYAARALGTIVTDDSVLTRRNGAALRLLHAQKYLTVILPRAIDGASKVDGTKRETAYLIAVASVVNAVPKSLYETQMPMLMPLLLRGLEIADFDIRRRIIETLADNINALSNDTQLSSHASTLVVAMLKNSAIADAPEYKVRVAALKYLALLPGAVRYNLLHPYKARVLKELAKVLDDPKRAVRKMAVDARTKWYKYSG